MWNLARAIGLLFVLFVCVGCDSVMMQHPIGEVVDDSEGRKLDGVWKTDNGVIHLRFASEGKLVVASLEWDEKQKSFVKKEAGVQLTQLGDDTFFSISGEAPADSESTTESSAKDTSLICNQYEVDYKAGELRIYPASVQQFATAVNDGKLAGTVTKEGRQTRVRITASAEELAKFVQSVGTETLFTQDKKATFAKRLMLPRP
jgi:hypothetical protein